MGNSKKKLNKKGKKKPKCKLECHLVGPHVLLHEFSTFIYIYIYIDEYYLRGFPLKSLILKNLLQEWEYKSTYKIFHTTNNH